MSSSTYTTVQGDTWDYIAYKALGNELYMDQMIDANPTFRKITIFNGGITLTVPAVSAVVSSSLPPWKRS